MASATGNTNVVEWALRVVKSMAFAIHGVLGVTEPFMGCLQVTFNDTHGAIPKWSWPVVGLLLWTVAIAIFSPIGAIMLAAQAYIASFHLGAFSYHQRLGHHIVVGLAPTLFALLAFFVVGIRTGSYDVSLAGWGVCTVIAFGLSRSEEGDDTYLLTGEIGETSYQSSSLPVRSRID